MAGNGVDVDMAQENKEFAVTSTENVESSNSTNETVLPGYTSMEEFTQSGFMTLMEATRRANTLPLGQDWSLFSSYPSFQRVMTSQGQKILELISRIFHQQGIKGNIARRELDEKMDLIVDANDAILERVSMNLDELDGIRRNPVPELVEASSSTKVLSGSWNKRPAPALDSTQRKTVGIHSVRLLTAKNIERPQAKFKDKIDNTNTPFVPRIKDKPNSLRPLALFLEETELGDSYCHPYEVELGRFQPLASQLMKVTPSPYKPVHETPLEMITTCEQLSQLVKDLEQRKEIAIDLEHHSYRTFQGITCLMQISTREKDYIVDTLGLRDSLHILNEVFTKPTIVKVFHGADHDIEWLQRDLSLYIVNMFDTHQAAKVLNFPHLSLSYLLKTYCNLDINKHFQLADWRIRPLPEELVLYAREDTHYLLYVYDVMTNALIDAANGQDNLLNSVIQRSTMLCMKRYMKPIRREDSYMDVYRRNKKLFDNRQLFALKEIYNWRDSIARQEDESTGYVLPNHMLLQISETLPREMQGVLACCNPIPPLVRQNLVVLHQMVLQAREQPLIKIIEENRPAAQVWHPNLSSESPLHCPHDLTKTRDFRDDLPTLLLTKKQNKREGDPLEGPSKRQKPSNTCNTTLEKTDTFKMLQKPQPIMTLFQKSSHDLAPILSKVTGESSLMNSEQKKQVTFVSPYQRLLLVQPFNQSQEKEEAQETEAIAATTSVNVTDRKDAAVVIPVGRMLDTLREDSNAERIARIKEHFLHESARLREQEAKLLSDTLDNQKKRKRDPDDIEGNIQIKEEKPEILHHSMQLKVEEGEQLTVVKKKKNKKKKKKKQQNAGSNSTNQAIQQNAGSNSTNQAIEQITTKQELAPFDYSKVDYSQFKGGSGVNKTQIQMNERVRGKSKFKNKSTKKDFMGVSNNRSCSFRGKR